MYERPCARLKNVAKSYSSSAILKHWKAGTECACSAVFETCYIGYLPESMCLSAGQKTRGLWERMNPWNESSGASPCGSHSSRKWAPFFKRTDLTWAIWLLLISCNHGVISCFYHACYRVALSSTQSWLINVSQAATSVQTSSFDQSGKRSKCCWSVFFFFFCGLHANMKGPYQSL